MTKNEFLAALRNITQEYWDKHQFPLLLSQLPKELEAQTEGDYKPLLTPGGLKRFIKESELEGGYRLVEHPSLRAKIGIVPSEVEFEFQQFTNPQSIDTVSRQDIEGFCKILKSLTPDERRTFSLPATLVVRLLDLQ